MRHEMREEEGQRGRCVGHLIEKSDETMGGRCAREGTAGRQGGGGAGQGGTTRVTYRARRGTRENASR